MSILIIVLITLIKNKNMRLYLTIIEDDWKNIKNIKMKNNIKL